MDEYTEEAEPSWRDDLPEELRDVSFIRAAESPEHAAAEIKNAAQYMGQSVRLPKEGEDRTAFIEKIQKYLPEQSAPESAAEPEGFEVPEDSGIPDNIIQQAKDLGLSQTQFDALAERLQSESTAQQEQLQEFRQHTADTLKQQWDTDTQTNLDQVAGFLNHSKAPEGITKAFQDGTLDATAVAWLHGLAQMGDEVGELPSHRSDPTDAIASIDQALRSGKVQGVEYQKLLDRKTAIMRQQYGTPNRRTG